MRYHSGIRFGLSEEEQSYIYWSCRNLSRLPEKQSKVLNALIRECAKGEEAALREALCTGRSLTNVSVRHFIAETALQRRCEEFYKKAAETIKPGK